MKILVVAGARPNFMKVAPILRAFDRRRPSLPGCSVRLVHTGQHYDEQMSEIFLRQLGIPAPDHYLAVGSGSHAEQTARIMVAFEPVCAEQQPDCVLVVGDVNSTFACAVTAKKLGVDVAHVEAGLRSFDRTMPEEINRLCTDAITDLFFTTDDLASDNLRREGVPSDRIHMVGNTMIDSLVANLDRACADLLPAGLEPGRFAILTLHRPSNVDVPETLVALVHVLIDIAARIPVVFPVHPRTRKHLDTLGLTVPLGRAGVRMLDPLPYLSFIGLVARARMVLTDSGGIQEETTFLGIPCLTLRDNTERPITCTLGTNRLVGTDPARIRDSARSVLEGGPLTPAAPPKWDGKAGERIAQVLVERYGSHLSVPSASSRDAYV